MQSRKTREPRDKSTKKKKSEIVGSYKGPFGINYFKYRTHEGDYFAKIYVVDEPDVDYSDRKKDVNAPFLHGVHHTRVMGQTTACASGYFGSVQ